MLKNIHLEMITPSKIMLDRDVELVVVPGSEGLFGVLPLHADLLSKLKFGFVEIYENGNVIKKIAINGGIADVSKDKITILSQYAENIDKDSPKKIKEKAVQSVGEEKKFLDKISELI
tara:strand:- start:11 stop:364 length:354 start_codon:yes stop_codon:yes gene_type:complete